MIRHLICVILLNSLITNLMTQDQDVKRNIEDKISFLKGNDTSRKLKFKDDLFYDSIIKKRCDALSLPKDSLRKFLCRNGFNDYNFEHFRIKLKDMNDLNESYFKKKYSKLNKHIADSSFNNITYDIEYIHDSVVLDILLSEHYVDFDDEKEINAVIGIGFYKQELTVRGKTTKKNVFL